MSLKDKNSHTSEIFDIIIGDISKLNHVIEHNVLRSVGVEKTLNIKHMFVSNFLCVPIYVCFFCWHSYKDNKSILYFILLGSQFLIS